MAEAGCTDPKILQATGQAMLDILLDRDGTVIKEKDYLCRPEELELLPGAGQALKSLQDMGCRLFLVTNQSGIGRGVFTLEDYHLVQARLENLLAEHGVFFQDEKFCPHPPSAGCTCRKPGTLMWQELVRDHDLYPETSLMIGDKPADLEFGAGAGLRGLVLVLTGYGRRTAERLGCPEIPDGSGFLELNRTGAGPDLLARDLPAAAAWIRNFLIQNFLGPERPARGNSGYK
ncbi:MAG: HAD family hydrolase [Desulfohalobiaceae bacterium]|nr:HAD family hydrolase [Desulfohalobiaceae bacterium]